MSLQYLQSPLGLLAVEAHGGALCRVAPDRDCLTAAPDAVTQEAVRQLEEYFSGRRKEFTLPLAPQGTAFERLVWSVLAKVPYGRVVTYGQLASAAGRPGACRAAANAVGKNPLLILLPCHRVVAADGIGGFSAGLDRKRALLRLEDVEIPEKKPFPRKYFFTFP